MWKSSRILLLMTLVVVCLGCQPSETESTETMMAPDPTTETQAEAAADGPDAVAVDPAHYSVVEENDRVRVLRITYPPGESSVMHHHPDAVAVFLTEHNVKFELPDGSTTEAPGNARDALFTPAGAHLPTNAGDAPLELILVELKNAHAASPAGGQADAGPDPTVVDPAHYSVVFENERVRAVRIKYGPGESSVMHYHPDSVAVFFDDLQGKFESPDGSTQEVSAKAGQAMYEPAGQHLPTSTSDAPFELIQIELK